MSCIPPSSIPKLKNNKLTQRDKAHELYPYESGDFIVLGPEIFADRTGTYISWRGYNYVRQVPLRPEQLDPLQIDGSK